MRSIEATLETPEELSAINDMLSAIGEDPVNSLDGDANVDVANCRRILNNVNREVQAKGWTFNEEEGVLLQGDIFSGLIPYLSDYLRLMNADGASTLVNRGGYVYDKDLKTDVFKEGITVNMIRLKDFSEMPECFRTWIVTEASKKFNIRFFGASEIDVALSDELKLAKAACMEYELDYARPNMLDGDSYVQGLITR